jgi:hypothetical protein
MMTDKQFEEYLQSIGGLINGWREDPEPIMSRHFCSVGDGWLQLLHDCIAELLAAGWDKHVLQIKEKFGGLRFYIGSSSQEVHDIIMKYEELSYETCEVCGETGRPRTDLGWHRTLCDKHYKELVIEKTQEAIQNGLNRVMSSGLPVELKNVLSRDKYRTWETKVYWEIPALHCSKEFNDVMKCLKDCETYLNALSTEEKLEYRNKLGYDV